MLREEPKERLMSRFELKDFTPEQLAKWQTLNPNLYTDLGIESTNDSYKDLLEAIHLNTETWTKLEKTYAAREEAYTKYVKASKGEPLFKKEQLLSILLFFVLLLVLI